MLVAHLVFNNLLILGADFVTVAFGWVDGRRGIVSVDHVAFLLRIVNFWVDIDWKLKVTLLSRRLRNLSGELVLVVAVLGAELRVWDVLTILEVDVVVHVVELLLLLWVKLLNQVETLGFALVVRDEIGWAFAVFLCGLNFHCSCSATLFWSSLWSRRAWLATSRSYFPFVLLIVSSKPTSLTT